MLDELPYPIIYDGPPVNDEISNECEIHNALYKMRNRKSPGLTKITVDLLKEWYTLSHPPQEAEVPPDKEAMENWNKVVLIIQQSIRDGNIPEAFFLGILVLIPKNTLGDVRGIGLLDAIHKLISTIINIRLSNTISFHDSIHGFRKGRGCFTAIGETKLSMQRAVCNNITLYQVYIDLRKAYDSIDRKITLRILKAYGLGPNLLNYIGTIWERQRLLLRQNGFYSSPIDVKRGCTQGDVESPIIFNILIDSVLRCFYNHRNYIDTDSSFYADDGRLENINPYNLQNDLDLMFSLFLKLGLHANENKTKFMIIRGPRAPAALSLESYNKRMNKEGIPDKVWRKMRSRCEICEKELSNGAMSRHKKLIHNINTFCYNSAEKSVSGSFDTHIVKGVNHCPVPGCDGTTTTRFGMCRHFAFRHPEATLSFDGINLPKCPLCKMHHKDMVKHMKTDICKTLQKRRNNELMQELQASAEDVSFTVNGIRIERVSSFIYLGRRLDQNDDDSTCITTNLKKARSQWSSISNILKREGANAVTMSKFYRAIVQSVLLYGADSWTFLSEKEPMR